MLLYCHIPFCDSKCHYCAFNSFTYNHHLKKEYMRALVRQLRRELEQKNPSKLQSVFIGGGTPSTIDANLYEPLFELLEPLLGEETEITFEANPNSATYEWLKAIKALGANRVSFGVQSFDEKKLKFLGRAHTPAQAIQAIENAQKAEFDHINLDIIYDTAMDTKELLQYDITQALALPIDHISAYALTIEEKTPFAKSPQAAANKEEFGYLIKELITLPQYEVSNFGNYRCRHNIGYWELLPYIGVGCGAVGFDGKSRYYPPNDLHSYIQNPLSIRQERLSPEDLRLERLFLGLRSVVGVERSLCDEKKAQILLDEGKLIQKGDRLYNPNFFLADELALYLLAD